MPLDPVPSVEVVGNGATISYTLDGENYTPFAKLVDVGGGGGGKWSAAEIANTLLASTTKTSQPGSPDLGEVTLTLRYNSSIVSLVRGWMKAKTILGFLVTVVDGDATAEPPVEDSEYAFIGWVKEFDPIAELKEDTIVDTKITIKVVGVPEDDVGS